MATKITYIIGAGASFPILPLAVDIPDKSNPNNTLIGLATRLNQLAEDYKLQVSNNSRHSANYLSAKIVNYYNKVIKPFKELSEQSLSFNTIDTLAKFYFLKKKDKLPDLKRTLNEYFLVEQLLLQKFCNH